MQFTWIRTAVLGLLALVGIAFPGLIPDAAREEIATYAEQAVGAVFAIWAIFAGARAVRQKQTQEAIEGKRPMPKAPEAPGRTL